MSHTRSALRSSSALGALVLGFAALAVPTSAARAQSATPLPPVAVDTTADLSAPSDGNSLDDGALKGKRLNGGDTAQLLRSVPGITMGAGGGVSSLPSIHGLADDRILQLVDGIQTTSTCPNHMNPPLSYIEPTQVGKIDVFSGISPVSRGGDNIGGVVSVDAPSPVFAAPGEAFHVEGRASAYYKSNASNVGTSASATAATQDVSLTASGGWNRAADYRAGGGDSVSSTSYETMDYAVTAAMRHDGQSLVLKAGQQFIPYENFPNQDMDMTANHQAFANAHYRGEFDWGSLDATGFWNHVNHEMNDTTSDKHYNMMPMPMFTDSVETGYSLKGEVALGTRDTLRIGNELHLQTLNDYWPATETTSVGMMGPLTFVDINNGRRDRFGTYVEWERKWTPAWTTLAGPRPATPRPATPRPATPRQALPTPPIQTAADGSSGDREVVAVPSPPRPSVSAPAEEDPLPAFAQQLWAHIAQHPPSARKFHGVTVVTFTIGADGSLLSSAVAASSGSGPHDRAALAALAEAAPLPRPPPSLAPDRLSFTIAFEFR